MSREKHIDGMVTRFLQWKLPSSFSPDGGISFVKRTDGSMPVGTNLFSASEARDMIEHIMAHQMFFTSSGAPIDRTDDYEARVDAARQAEPEKRDTFVVLDGWEAERDDDGRATGMLRNRATGERQHHTVAFPGILDREQAARMAEFNRRTGFRVTLATESDSGELPPSASGFTIHPLIDDRPRIYSEVEGMWLPMMAGQSLSTPHDLFRFALESKRMNSKPVDLERVDMERLGEWAEYCLKHRLLYGGREEVDDLFSGKHTLFDVLNLIAIAGQAVVFFRDARWTVSFPGCSDFKEVTRSSAHSRWPGDGTGEAYDRNAPGALQPGETVRPGGPKVPEPPVGESVGDAMSVILKRLENAPRVADLPGLPPAWIVGPSVVDGDRRRRFKLTGYDGGYAVLVDPESGDLVRAPIGEVRVGVEPKP